MMGRSSPVTHDNEVKANMTPVRRIAAAVLVAALGTGIVGLGTAPANADYSWGTKIKVPR
ncbi:hypothetical protein NOZE110980_15040 [Nocardioides zeicaulis]